MDVFSLLASITLDTKNYESQLNDAGKKTSSFGDKLKSGFSKVAKVGASAIGAAATAVGDLTKQALSSYGDFEQLAGGVETLFKTSADVVMEYANNAYKTAGMSANEYMETVTSFSASLLQSLDGDTAAAAEIADEAIRDMSDNANKMGTDMQSIQNAYQGFAKQNFTMLDNLKLGYGGTKEEMERLLLEAEKLPGALGREFDISNYADIVEAIHLVQTEMGISGISAEEAAEAVASGVMTQEEAFEKMGTTAKEAATTIQGSLSSAKSAWKNLLAGVGSDSANIDELVNNLVETVTTAGDNILPRIEKILSGIGEVIEKLAPMVAEQLPPLLQSMLPSLLKAGGQMVGGLAKGIISAAPGLIRAGIPLIGSLISGISDAMPEIANSAVEIFTTLIDGMSEQLPTLVPVAVEAVLNLVETLTDPAQLNKMMDSAFDLVLSLADGIINSLPTLLAKAPIIVANLATSIVSYVFKLSTTAYELISKFAQFIADNFPKVVEKGRELVNRIVSGIKEKFYSITNSARELVDKVISGIREKFYSLLNIGKDVVNNVKNGITQKIDEARNWGKDLIDNFTSGIRSKIESVRNAVSNVANTVKGFLGFSEPDEGPLSNFHTYAPDMMKLFAKGITDNAGLLKDAFNKSLDISVSPVSLPVETTYSGGVRRSGTMAAAQFGDINININGAQYSNSSKLAEAVAQEIQNIMNRRSAVYA